MPSHPLIVHLQAQADAECVVDALAPHAVRLEEERGRWDVHVDLGFRSLDEALTALHECLLANEIARVDVSVDGKTYPMAATLAR